MEARALLPGVEREAALGAAFDRPVGGWSQGMRARLGFAVAVATPPAVLLLDEVHEALDHEYRERVGAYARGLLDEGGIVVAAGHDHPLLEQISTRAIWLAGGSILADGAFGPCRPGISPRSGRARVGRWRTGAITTIPYSWYSDEAVLRLEQERIFASAWQYVGHLGRVAEPGSFFTAVVGQVPIVIVRGRGGELRAFLNVCRHRGSLLCEGEGRRETLQCPYHAWTYDLDGSLRSAPRSDREPGFDLTELGLRPAAVGTWGPFVFVNPDPGARPLAETLGELPAILADGGIDVDTLVFDARAEADEYAANWKVCVENFLECYHCAVAHPSLAKAIDVSADAYRLETRPTFSSQIAAPRNGGGGVDDATGEIEAGQFHLLFPNTVINVMPGHTNLSIGPVLPRARNARTATWTTSSGRPGRAGRRVSRARHPGRRRGPGARRARPRRDALGAVEHGRLLPESEQLIAHFQTLLVDALG